MMHSHCRKEIQALQRRVSALERQVGLPVTTTRPGAISRLFSPSPTPFENAIQLGNDDWMQDGQQTAIQPQPAQPQPWGMSKSVRLTEQLTTFEFAVKAQLGQSLLFGLIGFLIGAILALLFEWIWYTPFLFGTVTVIISLMVLVIDHRGMLHKVVSDNRPQQPKKQDDLRVAIIHNHNDQPNPNISFLYLDGKIEHSDILLMAKKANEGKSLSVHGWTGQGGWTLPKLTSFFAELEAMGYVTPGRGSQPRKLTRDGRLLFRALAE